MSSLLCRSYPACTVHTDATLSHTAGGPIHHRGSLSVGDASPSGDTVQLAQVGSYRKETEICQKCLFRYMLSKSFREGNDLMNLLDTRIGISMSSCNYSQLSMLVVSFALEWNFKKEQSFCPVLKVRHNPHLHGKAPTSDFFPGRPVRQTRSTALGGSPWIL